MYQNEGDISDYVINLANFLRHCGVNCDIPSYHLNEDVKDWDDFIAKCIEKAEYILLVCTKELNEKLTGQSHNKVEMINAGGPYIFSSTLKSLLAKSKKTLPVILEEGNKKYIPHLLQSTTIYTISLGALSDAISANQKAKKILNDSKFQNFKSLFARLTGQELVPKPEVAQSPPKLSSKHGS